MNIITGYKGTPHINAQQDRDINSAIFTDGVYILNVGSKMSATIVSANEVTIADGLIIAQGCAAEIARGTSESMTIDNGTQGQLRKDLIVLRYTKDNSTGVEDMTLAVIKGTPAAFNPATPAYTSGSIADGDTLAEFPLYEVNLSGITIQSVVLLATKKSIADKKSVDDLSAKVGTGTLSTTAKNLIGAVNELLGKIGTGTLSTTANNLVGAVNELLGKIGTGTFSTTAKNAVGAINELLGKINTANSNISAVANRASALETKTAGFSGTILLSVPNGETNYRRLNAVATYLVIVSTVADVDAMKGLYIVGVQSNNSIGIKAVSNASSVTLVDQGNLLLGIRNNGASYIRVNIITLYGTAL